MSSSGAAPASNWFDLTTLRTAYAKVRIGVPEPASLPQSLPRYTDDDGAITSTPSSSAVLRAGVTTARGVDEQLWREMCSELYSLMEDRLLIDSAYYPPRHLFDQSFLRVRHLLHPTPTCSRWIRVSFVYANRLLLFECCHTGSFVSHRNTTNTNQSLIIISSLTQNSMH